VSGPFRESLIIVDLLGLTPGVTSTRTAALVLPPRDMPTTPLALGASAPMAVAASSALHST
jgi:hypothetical protein